MHAVWRKRQGLPHTVEVSKGLSTNASHLTVHAAIPNFAKPDPSVLKRAFGFREPAKLVRAIAGTEASGPEAAALRAAAIEQAIDTMHGAAQLESLVAAGIVAALNKVVVAEAEPRAEVHYLPRALA